jgi:hypothetical protein
MTDSFKTTLCKDATIGDITSDMEYQVKSGAAQTTYQTFGASSTSNSALNINIQVPSENVVMGRDVLLTSGLTFTVRVGPGVPNGQQAFQYGLDMSLAAFPLAAIMSTLTSQINNTTCSINLQDCLPPLLRLNDSRELYRFNGMTPSLPDQVYASYSEGVGAANNPMAGIKNGSYDVDQMPRGAFPCKISIYRKAANGDVIDSSPVSAGADEFWDVVISTVVTEPLFLSPFIFGEPSYNSQGIMGINNMVFTMNIDTTLKRMFCTGLKSNGGVVIPSSISAGTTAYAAIAAGGAGARAFKAQDAIVANPLLFQAVNFGALVAPTQPSLLVKFLSVQPTDLIQTKNVVPYMSYPRYITTTTGGAPLAPGGRTTITSSSLQLNQLPDVFIIVVRKPMALQTISDPNFFLKIQSISVNLNNQSGLLSSASPEQLWRLSQKNGSTQNWLEFCGISIGNPTEAPGLGVGASVGAQIGTIGSMLILDPAYDLSLSNYLSSGSLGNYNFQFQMQVYNQTDQAFVPEVCVICVNSGVMVTDRGMTTTMTGILTKEMVLDAKSKPADATSVETHRLIGGSMYNMGASVKKHHNKTAPSSAAKRSSKLDGFF